MYLQQQTILLKLLLKRLIRKPFELWWNNETIIVYPLAIGTNSYGYNHRVIVLFQNIPAYNILSKEDIRVNIEMLGFVYGLNFRCIPCCVDGGLINRELLDFKNRYDNVIIGSPENVEATP